MIAARRSLIPVRFHQDYNHRFRMDRPGQLVETHMTIQNRNIRRSGLKTQDREHGLLRYIGPHFASTAAPFPLCACRASTRGIVLAGQGTDFAGSASRRFYCRSEITHGRYRRVPGGSVDLSLAELTGRALTDGAVAASQLHG